MSIRIAINGFGRIGRNFVRALLTDQTRCNAINIVAINLGNGDPAHAAHLFKYDSIMRTYPGPVTYEDGKLLIDHHSIILLHELDPLFLPWKDLSIDWVIECTGKFTTKELAAKHLSAGAKKTLISAPAHDADITIIHGINHLEYNDNQHHIVSLGSCTTNCFAPLVKVIHEHLVLEQGLMTTIHAYTNDQVLLDVDHKDLRRARSAGMNIIPTKTGAEKTIMQIYPELKGKIQARAVRVPVPTVSLIDFAATTKKSISTAGLNDLFKEASESYLSQTLAYTEQPLVSSDFVGNSYAATVDGLLTQSIGPLNKIYAWYDNEYGYSSRMKEFLLHIC